MRNGGVAVLLVQPKMRAEVLSPQRSTAWHLLYESHMDYEASAKQRNTRVYRRIEITDTVLDIEAHRHDRCCEINSKR